MSGFRDVSHPTAALQPYLRYLQRQVVAGYRLKGFAEAQVDAEVVAETSTIRVTIQEGPRWRAGKIIVEGNSALSAAEISRILEDPEALISELGLDPGGDGRERDASMLGVRPGKSTASLAADALKELSAEVGGSNFRERIWRPGRYAWFADFGIQEAWRRVQWLYGSRGLRGVRGEVEVVRREGRVADLVVRIESEGPLYKVGKTHFLGNYRDEPDEISRRIGLEPGIVLDNATLVELRQKLEALARYAEIAIETE